MPKISIIIPVYKVEKYLFDCLNSVLLRTFHGLKVISMKCVNHDKCDKILVLKKKNNKGEVK